MMARGRILEVLSQSLLYASLYLGHRMSLLIEHKGCQKNETKARASVGCFNVPSKIDDAKSKVS